MEKKEKRPLVVFILLVNHGLCTPEQPLTGALRGAGNTRTLFLLAPPSPTPHPKKTIGCPLGAGGCLKQNVRLALLKSLSTYPAAKHQ